MGLSVLVDVSSPTVSPPCHTNGCSSSSCAVSLRRRQFS